MELAVFTLNTFSPIFSIVALVIILYFFLISGQLLLIFVFSLHQIQLFTKGKHLIIPGKLHNTLDRKDHSYPLEKLVKDIRKP